MADSRLQIFVVDDDLPSRLMLRSIFSDEYEVELFDSAETCLARLEHAKPGLLLLNLGLPGMDGLAMCRLLKSEPTTAHIPVIIISRRDDTETRLTWYDAGGEDFVLKPYAIDEVRRKVDIVRKAVSNAAALRQKIEASQTLAAELTANLGAYTAVIGFIQNLNTCNSNEEIAEAILGVLRTYQLEGAVQIRGIDEDITLSEDGCNRPLEISMIESIRSLDRIVEFKRRFACNFESVTLLIKNMPLDDSGLCKRIRDNLLIVTECANAHIQAKQYKTRDFQSKEIASAALDALQSVIVNFHARYSQARSQSSLQTRDLLEELARTFASLGLSDAQEARIDEIVRTRTEQMTTIYDFSDEIYSSLSAVARQFAEILNTANKQKHQSETGSTTTDQGQDIELF